MKNIKKLMMFALVALNAVSFAVADTPSDIISFDRKVCKYGSSSPMLIGHLRCQESYSYGRKKACEEMLAGFQEDYAKSFKPNIFDRLKGAQKYPDKEAALKDVALLIAYAQKNSSLVGMIAIHDGKNKNGNPVDMFINGSPEDLENIADKNLYGFSFNVGLFSGYDACPDDANAKYLFAMKNAKGVEDLSRIISEFADHSQKRKNMMITDFLICNAG